MSTFKFAFNSHGRDKAWNYELLAARYQDRSGTLADVIQHISQGHALCAGLLGGKRRSKANVTGSQWILLDIDNSNTLKDEGGKPVVGDDGKAIKVYRHDLTLDEALAHPFVQQHCSLIYTTASHRPEWQKFRMVFVLPECLVGSEAVEAAVRLLMDKFPHDPACKDASRVFYGNTQAEFPLFNPRAYLPVEWIAQAEQAKLERQQQLQEQAARRQRVNHAKRSSSFDSQITPAAMLDAIGPNLLDWYTWRDCLLAAHHENISEAEIRGWSARSVKHCDRGFDAVYTNIKGSASGLTAGTLWHLATEQGWQTPQLQNRDWEGPDPAAYQAHEQWEQETSRVEEVEAEHSTWERLKGWAARLKGGVGFGTTQRVPRPRTAKAGKKIRYVPGRLLPRQEFGTTPKILYKAEQLPQLLLEARAKGWQDVLDSGAPGSGKSHNYAQLPLQVLLEHVDRGEEETKQLNRVWLLAQTHRNPTVAPAERLYADLPVRHHGLVKDNQRKTPMGKDFQRWPKQGEKPDIRGNCHLTGLFHKAAAKGIRSASATAELNPICGMCSHKDYCGRPESIGGSGYGFRAERGGVFKHQKRVRASIDSLPNPADYPAYASDTAVLDEAMQQLQPVRAINVELRDFDSGWADLDGKLPEAYDLLTPLRRALRPLVAGEGKGYHGVDDAGLREQLPAVPEGFNELLETIRAALDVQIGSMAQQPDHAPTSDTTEAVTALRDKITRRGNRLERLQARLEQLYQRRGDLEQEQGSLLEGREKGRFKGFSWTAGQAKKLIEKIAALTAAIAGLKVELEDLQNQLERLLRERQTVQNFNSKQRRDSKQNLETALDNLPMQWLVPFLEVWSKEVPGALRVSPFGGLSVTVMESRQNDILNSLKLRIYLDATCTPETLSLYRQIPAGDILNIEMDFPKPENLDFIWVQGLGLAGKQRSESCDQRIAALLGALRGRHSDLISFDWLKKKAASGADGHWFSDFTRGTNEFSNRSAIAAVGLPMPNYGAFYDLHLTLTRDSEIEHLSFQEFYRQLIDSEVVQAVGRLRANRRPEQKLTFYLLGDSEKSRSGDWQPPPEINAKVVQAREITPEAATLGEKAWVAVTEVIKRWWSDNGELPSQTDVERETGFGQGYISKLAAQFVGGWKQLKKIFQSLYSLPYRDWNIFEHPTEQETWGAQVYLPEVVTNRSEVVAGEINGVIESVGWGGWRRIVAQTTFKLRTELAWALLRDGWTGVTP